ncbi:S8 family serine peptidase [Salinibacterium sp.]|uniref:S8 family serine peptidase n=1 Tax=Salinibacterium sp. TaxID=1915057 RepID=UPI00286CC8E8|nr:S8 family serine peptidase [Salinibacterium sp.]
MRTRVDRAAARPTIRSFIAACATASLLAAGLVAGTAGAALSAPGGSGQTALEPGRYIVTLSDAAVATYDGGIPGYPATSPDGGDQLNMRRAPALKYSDYLTEKQQAVATAAGVTIDASYTTALNGFSADLTSAQAAQLMGNRGVIAVTLDEMKHITAVPSTSFLGLDGPGGVWESIGGADQAGDGVVVGVLDTGIAAENPAFTGQPLVGSAAPAPYLDGQTITFAKSDGGIFRSVCQAGEQFTASDCSTKVIGARYFLNGFGANRLGNAGTGPGEFVSPRDGDGHGSHTASTAAGNVATPATVGGIDFGRITGVAPAAKIAVYKVCWSGPDPTVTTDDGCTTTDLLAAIDQAVTDGVDVINYSIGGGAAQTTFSPTDEAFLGAASAGVFVAASAGNDGPAASTLDNASPWITTVAASTIPSYEATATLGDGTAFAGASITVNFDLAATPLTGALVNSTAYAAPGVTDANLCGPSSLTTVPPGTIVVCDRGVYNRTAKSAEVLRAGGIGMLLVNRTPGSIDTDLHAVPTVHLDSVYRAQIVAYAAAPGATVTFTTGNQTSYTPPAPQVAGFSSRGPLLADGSDLLKPDISAPGVSILAAGPNQESTAPTFEFLSGTSMAAPHIAGLAALYLGERPNATPAEVKSAMMTTAGDTLDAAGAAVSDPFIQGAGQVDPTRFFEPGLLYLNGTPDWLAYLQALGYNAGVAPVDPSNLNLASISVGTLTAPEAVTRTVTSTQAGTFTSTVDGLNGVTAVVEPSTLEFGAAGQTATYTVTFARTDAALDEFATGSITWTSGETTVRSPIAVRPVAIVAPAGVDGTGITGSVDVTVTPGADGDIPLATSGLSLGVLVPDPKGVETVHSGSAVTGGSGEYFVDVPAGAEFARFDLDAIDNTTDLDLTVNQLDADGKPVMAWKSATGSADERVDLIAPEAARYQVLVDVFAAAGGTAWDLTVTSVVAGGAPLTLTPPVLAGVQGTPVTFVASWADLVPQSTYLGIVSYGTTGRYTAVQVKTGEAPLPSAPLNLVAPAITGAADVGNKLAASPGEWDTAGLTFAYQWQSNGVDLAGATASAYTVVKGDQGNKLAVVVTASAAGLPPGTATSEAVTVRYESTTALSLSRRVFFSWQSSTAKVAVTSLAASAATGNVKLTINGRTTTTPLTLAADGTVSYKLPKLTSGVYVVKAAYEGDGAVAGSVSSTKLIWVIF